MAHGEHPLFDIASYYLPIERRVCPRAKEEYILAPISWNGPTFGRKVLRYPEPQFDISYLIENNMTFIDGVLTKDGKLIGKYEPKVLYITPTQQSTKTFSNTRVSTQAGAQISIVIP